MYTHMYVVHAHREFCAHTWHTPLLYLSLQFEHNSIALHNTIPSTMYINIMYDWHGNRIQLIKSLMIFISWGQHQWSISIMSVTMLHFYNYYLYRYGPATSYWCMHFEAKHSYFKNLSRKVNCFKNITQTLAEHHQIRMCYYAHSNGYYNDLTLGRIRYRWIVKIWQLFKDVFGNYILWAMCHNHHWRFKFRC